MAILKLIYTRYRMSQAGVIVQNLLEQYEQLIVLQESPSKLASILIADVWRQKPDAFEGRLGVRPHNISVAAIALANGLYLYKENENLKDLFMVSLADILKEIEINRGFYSFNKIDNELLNRSHHTFNKETEKLNDSSIISWLNI